MRWLCNENVPRLLVEALKTRNEDVIWIRDHKPGAADDLVLAFAADQRRICLTFDRDFGELAVRAKLPAECGVLLLRIAPQPSVAWGDRIAETICSRNDWAGHFSVLEPGRIRMRPLP
jgi:predicted nuclease of predicted toxin-antitoxin system